VTEIAIRTTAGIGPVLAGVTSRGVGFVSATNPGRKATEFDDP
jgi:hypothetical protein